MLVKVILQDSVEEVEVDENEILDFPRGVVGFEELTRYALFRLEHPLYLLQAVDDPEVGFVVMDPFLLDPAYRLYLAEEDRSLLGLEGEGSPEVLCIVTLSPEGAPGTANLRAPVAINPSNRLGAQVILQESNYPVRYPIASSADGTIGVEAMAAEPVEQDATVCPGGR